MLIQLMSSASINKHLSCKPVFVLGVVSCKVEYTEATREIFLVGVVLYMRNNRRAWVVTAAWIAKVVREISKSVDFEFLKRVEGHFVEKPVYDHTAFDSTLRVQYEDDFLLLVV